MSVESMRPIARALGYITIRKVDKCQRPAGGGWERVCGWELVGSDGSTGGRVFKNAHQVGVVLGIEVAAQQEALKQRQVLAIKMAEYIVETG